MSAKVACHDRPASRPRRKDNGSHSLATAIAGVQQSTVVHREPIQDRQRAYRHRERTIALAAALSLQAAVPGGSVKGG